MVEGTPLLREHLGKTWIEGSNPSVSARHPASMRLSGAFLFLHTQRHTQRRAAWPTTMRSLEVFVPAKAWAEVGGYWTGVNIPLRKSS